jgi:putative endonuclease
MNQTMATKPEKLDKLSSKSSSVWYVYIILASDNSLYTGITVDIQRRINQHLSDKKKGAKYFRARKPKQLLYLIEKSCRSDATKLELTIKKYTRIQKLELIKSQSPKHPLIEQVYFEAE